MSEHPDLELVSTPIAAAGLGISARTLQRYVEQEILEPRVRLPTGQFRWTPAELAQQIAAVAAARPAGPTRSTGPSERAAR